MLYPICKRSIMSMAVAGACATLAPMAVAQEAQSDVQVVPVTGFRASVQDALSLKRNTDGFLDAISSDGLGRFPDLNVGEALARIPGIQINREAKDREATINLRGLPGNFATITINGLSIADPTTTGGGVPLGAFSSDAFSRMVVNKSPSAADAAGGLSGNIDLQIAGALTRKDGVNFKLSEEYNELGRNKSPALSVGFTKHLNPDLAVFGMFTAKKELFRRDELRVNSFQQLGAPGTAANFVRSTAPAVGTSVAAVSNLADFADYYAAPGDTTPGAVILNVPGTNTRDGKPIVGTGLKSKTGVLFGKEIRQVIREAKGKLLTTATGAELKVNSELKLGGSVFYTRRSIDQGTTQVLNTQTGQGATLVTGDPSSVFIADSGQAYLNKYSYTNGFQVGSGRDENTVNQTGGITGTVNWRSADWRLATAATVSRAKGEFDGVNIDLQRNPGAVTAANPAGNGSYGAVDLGYGDVHQVRTSYLPGGIYKLPGGTLNLNSIVGKPAGVINSLGFAQITGTTGDWIQLNETYQLSKNRVNAIQQDVERFVENPWFSSVQAGVRFEDNKYTAGTMVGSPVGANVAGLTQDLIGVPANLGSFFNNSINTNTNWPAGNIDYARAHLFPTKESLMPGNPLLPPGYLISFTPGGLVNNPNNISYYTGNYDINYKVSSLYLMGRIDTKVWDMPLRGNVGLRRDHLEKNIIFPERTSVTSGTGAAQVVTIKNVMREFDSVYNKNLPSVLLALDVAPKWVVRYAAYETYVKPQRREEAPVSNAVVSQGSTTRYDIVLGGNLKPYTAVSQDLGIEWYNRKGSVLSANLFQKKIKGLTYAINKANSPALACPANGLINGVDYGFGALRPYDAAADTCRAVNDDASNPQAGVAAPVYVNVTGVLNNPNTTTVQGIELTAQQDLSFLPYPWSNFGGQANYSYTKVRGKYPNGTPVIIDGVSAGNTNLIGYYEARDWGVRVIFNHRDKYPLLGASTFNGGSRTAKARNQVDFAASYKLTGNLTVALDIYNVTNSLREEYDQDPRVLRASSYDGRTVTLGLRGAY